MARSVPNYRNGNPYHLPSRHGGEKEPKAYYVNCMRKWHTPITAAFLSHDEGVKEVGEGRKEDTHAHMPLHQLKELQRFKEKYLDVLQDVPGRMGLVEHVIPTGNANPIRLPPYKLAHKSQEVLEEIRTLLDQGIIKPSTSLWAAFIVLVAKTTTTKNGTQRMCIDYRKLNEVTINDPYPLPSIEELIANL